MSKSLDSVDGLLGLLGSFWTELYEERTQVESFCEGVAETEKQLRQDTDQVDRALSFTEIDPYRTERWYPVQLNESELNSTPGTVLRFNEGATFGNQADGSVHVYGAPVARYYSFPVPANLRGFQYMAARLTLSGATYTNGIQVLLDTERSLLLFKDNPLLDPNLGHQVLSDGTQSTQSVTVWLSDALFEHSDVYRQHGFVFGLPVNQDSAVAKPGLEAVSDAVVGGSSVLSLSKLLEAGTGIPFARTAQTVLYSFVDRGGRVVITDKAVHRMAAAAPVPWSVGSVIPAGSFVSSDVAIADCRRGTAPDWLKALVLHRGLRDSGVTGDVTFGNQLVPLQASYATGEEVTQFELGGSPEAVASFFAILSQRLSAAGLRLAALTSASGEPAGQINPLRFLIKNWLRNSLLLVKITGTALLSPGAAHLAKLRSLLPPHTALVVLTDLQPQPARLTLGGTPRISRFRGTATKRATCPIGTARVSLRPVLPG